MVQAAIDDYVRLVDFFREKGAESPKQGIRASVVKKKESAATDHKLQTLFEKDVLGRWRPDDTPFPVDLATGDRINGEEANRRLDNRAERLRELLNQESLDEETAKELNELYSDMETTDLSQKMQAYGKALEIAEEEGIDTSTKELKKVEFRNPAFRYYLREEFQ